jgi:hypothetical protein
MDAILIIPIRTNYSPNFRFQSYKKKSRLAPMKRLVVSVVLFIAAQTLGFSISRAFAEHLSTEQRQITDQIREKIIQCAVRPLARKPTGGLIQYPWISQCQEVRVYHNRAQVETRSGIYTIYLYDSEYSDGGDLNDIEILDANGNIVFEATGVLAFGDVLYAVVGDDFSVPYVVLPLNP